MTTRLSKSKILAGLQCPKRLWLQVHQPDAAEVPADVQRRFDTGDAVGEAARRLHGDGHLIEWGNDDGSYAVAQTRAAMESSAAVFEATFAHEGVLVRADILLNEKRGCRLIEVKSSGKVKAPHYPDCAVQAWVLEGSGVRVRQVQVAHINTRFEYRDDDDYRGLFDYADITATIKKLKAEVPGWVEKFNRVLRGRRPKIDIGKHCTTPYPCPFIAHCSDLAPTYRYPVRNLPWGGKIADELEAEGIYDIRDIPRGRLRNEMLEWIRAVTASGRADLKPEAADLIGSLAYPRHYIDFETIGFAVPVWAGTRPYQQLPFQWSCHIETDAGELSHQEFLDTAGLGDPPMRRFIETLLDALGKTGAVLAYSPFEKNCLNELAERFPDLKPRIEKVIARLVDLLPVTRRNYYHPDLHGSWSIKSVLPTIAPHLDYAGLGEVQDGGAAQAAYWEIVHPDTGSNRAQSLAADLRAYCQRDTEALVASARFLQTGKVEKNPAGHA